MGQHNPDLKRGLDSVFDCFHFDWYPYLNVQPIFVAQNKVVLQAEVINKFNSFKPDVVFMHIQSGDVISIETAKYMAKNSLVLNWSGDVRHPLPQHYLDMGRNIHCTLFTNLNDIETCKQSGVNADYLQVGYDRENFTPFGKVSDKYPEIIFLGSNYTNCNFPLSSLRYEMVNRLKKEFGNKFGVYGAGWKGLESGNITYYAEEGKAYRSCKIAINLSHFAYKRYSSDRMYRILGSGAFCLSHRFPHIEEDYKLGEELVVWENIEHLVANIKYYLQNTREREKIAIKGCYKARTEYTWYHFAENLEKILKSNKYETKLG